MKLFNERSIKELNEKRVAEEGRDSAVESLAAELAAEKVKSMEKDAVIQNVTREVANLKLEVMKLKGG